MASEEAVQLFVARRLQALRRERRVTLSTLAEMTGMSAAHLSRLENGERQPSIATLLQLARVYGVSVSSLVDDHNNQGYHLVRKGEAPERHGAEGNYQVLTKAHSMLTAVRVELRAGEQSQDARHTGEEWIHVLDGDLVLTLSGEAVELTTGDAIHFDPWLLHQLSARRSTVALIVSTSATVSAQHPLPSR